MEAESVTLTEVPALRVKPEALIGALVPVEIEPVATRTALATEPVAPAIAAEDPEVVMLPPVAFKKKMPELLTVDPLTSTDESASAT